LTPQTLKTRSGISAQTRFLKAGIDLVGHSFPEAAVGGDERRNLALTERKAAIAGGVERVLGILDEVLPEVLVGYQPANQNLDTTLHSALSSGPLLASVAPSCRIGV
jgi:hypothetical protein